ncbi:MAG: nucleotide exchange factor GrpE [Candidatus Vogelbacteria bacterium]|nr:nucleotide exchange factor GrpE [Candidatus Vogelbacteria bacterium]
MVEDNTAEQNDFEIEPTDATESEQGAQIKIKKLRDELSACEVQRKDYLDGWQRAQADYVNARKEESSSRERLMETVRDECFHDLVPILDSFSMAMSGHGWADIEAHWRVGVEQIYNQLSSMLAKHHVEKFNPSGEQFDPNFHQAVAVVDVDDEKNDHQVIEVLQDGYRRGNRVIRPAQVKVGSYRQNKT